MRRHPVWGWRTQCVWIMCGLAGCAALPQEHPVSLQPVAEPEGAIILAAAHSTAPAAPRARPERPATPPSATAARPATPTGRPAAAPVKPAVQQQPADPLLAARQLEERGQLADARKAYTAILRQHPGNVECVHRLAVVCTRLNDFAAASEYYDRALQLSPENAAILSDAGYARYLAGQPAEAEKLLRRAVALAPKDVRAHNNLAVVVGVTGRLDESLSLFQKVNPPASAWINLAYVYQLRKEPDLALLCYQRAQALDASVQIPQGLLVQAKPADPVVVADTDLPPSPSVEPPKTQQRGTHPLESLVDASGEQSGVISVETTDSVTTVVVKSLTASDGVDSKGPESRPVESVVVESSAPESEDVSWIEAEKSKLAERRGRDGLKGFCLVALCDERKLVDAQEQFTAEHQGQVYHFASSDAVEKFRADPDKYAPVAGGLDVVAVRQGSEVVAGSLDFAVWYRDKLYLFSSPQRKADFCASPRLFAQDAR